MKMIETFGYLWVRVQSFLGSLLPSLNKTIVVSSFGGYRSTSLRVPIAHRLAYYGKRYPLYDEFLPMLSALISIRYPMAKIIDIGANVGDTVALMRLNGCESRILAAEASPRFTALFKKNMLSSAENLFANVEFIQAFVGNANHSLSLEHKKNGTAATKVTNPTSNIANAVPLNHICDEFVRLIKVDTDGYDHHVLASGMDFILDKTPILWFEADISNKNDIPAWIEVLGRIAERYSYMIAFDNYGTPLIFAEVNVSLLNQLLIYPKLREVSGQRTVNYFDFCLFPPNEQALLSEFLSKISSRIGSDWLLHPHRRD